MGLCLGAACTGCISSAARSFRPFRLCLGAACTGCIGQGFHRVRLALLCLGAACTGCIVKKEFLEKVFTLCLGAACTGCISFTGHSFKITVTLPRRRLHGVHRQKPTNCGTPFCSIRRESVDSFSEINNTDSCADYFPALFCCQGDLHHHYRQPRTGNRPVLRCEQHRLFLFILSSHYRRLL